jgi:lipopolysaccharide/colanic/teichoic acid biosynthesis glycosyltransferase
MKRAFDIVASGLGLLVLSPVLMGVALLIKLSSRGPVLFRHERVGRNFRPFSMYKFRTMVPDAPRLGGPLTAGDDPRITTIGRVLRKTKVDELPQLFNVLRGEMSLVGPRPEVPCYVDMYRQEYREILKARPGITDLASLKYRHEEQILGQLPNPEEEYVRKILPEKIRLSKEYLQSSSFLYDLGLIAKTFRALLA